jgi:hypothetical protein
MGGGRGGGINVICKNLNVFFVRITATKSGSIWVCVSKWLRITVVDFR